MLRRDRSQLVADQRPEALEVVVVDGSPHPGERVGLEVRLEDCDRPLGGEPVRDDPCGGGGGRRESEGLRDPPESRLSARRRRGACRRPGCEGDVRDRFGLSGPSGASQEGAQQGFEGALKDAQRDVKYARRMLNRVDTNDSRDLLKKLKKAI